MVPKPGRSAWSVGFAGAETFHNRSERLPPAAAIVLLSGLNTNDRSRQLLAAGGVGQGAGRVVRLPSQLSIGRAARAFPQLTQIPREGVQ